MVHGSTGMYKRSTRFRAKFYQSWILRTVCPSRGSTGLNFLVNDWAYLFVFFLQMWFRRTSSQHSEYFTRCSRNTKIWNNFSVGFPLMCRPVELPQCNEVNSVDKEFSFPLARFSNLPVIYWSQNWRICIQDWGILNSLKSYALK